MAAPNKDKPQKFSARYHLGYLLYYEKFTWIQEAIAREKEIKDFTRAKKWELIRRVNPQLEFLNHLFEYSECTGTASPRWATFEVIKRFL